MPLPWKKSRVSRISRIVADLQPPNRDNSLVVETGFPTSLIDLFVKNKERLKKKKKGVKKIEKNFDFDEEFVRDVEILSGYVCNSEKIEEIKSLDSELMVSERLDHVINGGLIDQNSQSQRPGLMFSVLKVFVVVALGLSTKRIAVGATVSVFFLMFLDYVCNHLTLANLLKIKHVRNVRVLYDEISFCKDSIFRHGKYKDLVEVIEFESPVEEIEPELVVGGAEVSSVMEVNSSRVDSDVETSVRVNRIGDLIREKEESRRDRLKSNTKFKRWLPRNLRKKGLKKKEGVGGAELPVGEENSVKSTAALPLRVRLLEEQDEEVEESERAGEIKCDHGIRRSISSGFDMKGEHELCCGIRRTKSTGALARTELFVVKKRNRTEQKGNSTYLILLLVILSGLVGGRFLAFLITVSSCLIFPLIRRNRKDVEEHTTSNPPSNL